MHKDARSAETARDHVKAVTCHHLSPIRSSVAWPCRDVSIRRLVRLSSGRAASGLRVPGRLAAASELARRCETRSCGGRAEEHGSVGWLRIQACSERRRCRDRRRVRQERERSSNQERRGRIKPNESSWGWRSRALLSEADLEGSNGARETHRPVLVLVGFSGEGNIGKGDRK